MEDSFFRPWSYRKATTAAPRILRPPVDHRDRPLLPLSVTCYIYGKRLKCDLESFFSLTPVSRVSKLVDRAEKIYADNWIYLSWSRHITHKAVRETAKQRQRGAKWSTLFESENSLKERNRCKLTDLVCDKTMATG